MFVFRHLIIVSMMVCSTSGTFAFPGAEGENAKLEGRWDLTLTMNGKEFPSWLEVEHSGIKTLVGRFVYLNGSARPIAKITFVGDKFSFTIPPQWESENKDLEFEGVVSPTGLAGTMVYVDGKKYNWTGVKAPSLKRTGEPVWGEPVNLFNGVDLKGWRAMGRRGGPATRYRRATET